jgi:hypothetical protein
MWLLGRGIFLSRDLLVVAGPLRRMDGDLVVSVVVQEEETVDGVGPSHPSPQVLQLGAAAVTGEEVQMSLPQFHAVLDEGVVEVEILLGGTGTTIVG